jgi:hypothetical protein
MLDADVAPDPAVVHDGVPGVTSTAVVALPGAAPPIRTNRSLSQRRRVVRAWRRGSTTY